MRKGAAAAGGRAHVGNPVAVRWPEVVSPGVKPSVWCRRYEDCVAVRARFQKRNRARTVLALGYARIQAACREVLTIWKRRRSHRPPLQRRSASAQNGDAFSKRSGGFLSRSATISNFRNRISPHSLRHARSGRSNNSQSARSALSKAGEFSAGRGRFSAPSSRIRAEKS